MGLNELSQCIYTHITLSSPVKHAEDVRFGICNKAGKVDWEKTNCFVCMLVETWLVVTCLLSGSLNLFATCHLRAKRSH